MSEIGFCNQLGKNRDYLEEFLMRLSSVKDIFTKVKEDLHTYEIGDITIVFTNPSNSDIICCLGVETHKFDQKDIDYQELSLKIFNTMSPGEHQITEVIEEELDLRLLTLLSHLGHTVLMCPHGQKCPLSNINSKRPAWESIGEKYQQLNPHSLK